MVEVKVFKRNKQLGKTLIILAVIVGLTLFIDSFYIESVKVRVAQVLVFACLLFFAFLEFTIPFALITPNFILVRESPFILKKILIAHIQDVKSFKGRFVVIHCKTWRKKIIYLKSIDVSEKNLFIQEISKIAKK